MKRRAPRVGAAGTVPRYCFTATDELRPNGGEECRPPTARGPVGANRGPGAPAGSSREGNAHRPAVRCAGGWQSVPPRVGVTPSRAGKCRPMRGRASGRRITEQTLSWSVAAAVSSSGDGGGIEPDGREAVALVRHPHVHVPAGSAERNRVEVLLTVVFPDDAGDDRHRLVERVLRHLGLEGVEDALSVTSRPLCRRVQVWSITADIRPSSN